MDEGLPPSIPFLPDLLVHHPEGALVTGMDGEFLWLNNEMQPLTPVSTPHPMRVRQATITDGHLIATWLDRELLLACMGAMPVGTAEEGKQRSELRTSIGSQTIHYPAGNTWAHALDAEPMALATDGTTVVFDLYRRGVYGIGINADEHWRMPPPTWSYPKRRPRNEETVALNVLGEECWVTSRGGRVQRRSLTDGQLLEEHLLNQVDAPVEHHFKHGEHDLLCSTEGTVTWLHDMSPIKQVRLSGPVQSAVYDEQAAGWRIAGWREEVVITRENEQRRSTNELPVHMVVMGSGALVLYNDGSWENSPFEFSVSKKVNITQSLRCSHSGRTTFDCWDGQEDTRSAVRAVLGSDKFPVFHLYFDHLALGFGPSPITHRLLQIISGGSSAAGNFAVLRGAFGCTLAQRPWLQPSCRCRPCRCQRLTESGVAVLHHNEVAVCTGSRVWTGRSLPCEKAWIFVVLPAE